MSLTGTGGGGTCNTDSLHQAICNSVNAGVTYVVAAGNSAADANNYRPALFQQEGFRLPIHLRVFLLLLF